MCLWDAGTEPPSEDAMVHGRTTSHMGTCVPRSTGPGWSLVGPRSKHRSADRWWEGTRTPQARTITYHKNLRARDFHAQTEPVPYSSLQQQTG